VKTLKRLLILSVVSLLFLASSFATSESYAYWASSVDNANNNTAVTGTIGTWIQSWSSSETYVVGDQVTNNGTTYQAKKDNPTKEPGVDNGWSSQWTAL